MPTTDQILPVPDPVPSYWLSDPHPLRALRSTPDLPQTCDVVVIGSGLAGIATVYHLLEGATSPEEDNRKKKKPPSEILLLEARDLCSGATARNGGHCKVKVATLASLAPGERRDEIQAYVLRTIDAFKEMVDSELGRCAEGDGGSGESLAEYCEFELRRTFDVFLERGEADAMKRAYDEGVRAGHAWTRNVSWIGPKHAEQVTSIRGAVGAFSGPACSLWPYKLAMGLLARLVRRYPSSSSSSGRLNVQAGTPVTSVVQIEEDTDSGKWNNVVTTPRGAVKARKVVFATNAYTAGLLPQFRDVIVPMKGMAAHMSTTAKGEGKGEGEGEVEVVHPHLANTYNIAFGPNVDYLNPRPDGGIVVGGGKLRYSGADPSVWYGNFDDATRFPADVERYWHEGEGYMQSTFHGWEDSGAVADKVWVGIMGVTPDGWPHVGRVPCGDGEKGKGNNGGKKKQQWVLAGFNGGGMALILPMAKAVAKMVRDDVDFEEVREEFGIPAFYATSEGRLKQGAEDDVLKRK